MNGNIIFTQTNSVTLSGVTQAFQTQRYLSIMKILKSTPVEDFSYQLENLTADQMVSVIATDNSGNNTIRAVRVVHITDEILFNFALSGATGRNPIIIDSPTITFFFTSLSWT